MPNDPNPWDVMPREPRGDLSPEPIHLAVGRALSAWEVLDEVQAKMFGVLVASRAESAASAYGTIQTSRGRSDPIFPGWPADLMVGRGAYRCFDCDSNGKGPGCRERESCPLFVARDLSGMFFACSGGAGCFGQGCCGRRL